MKFEKRLIILSGENNAKGTLTLERNAYGTFATVNAYNLPDLKSGEYCVGVKNSSAAFTREIGSLGRILQRFKLADDIELSDIHCVIFDPSAAPLLYGTAASSKLWAGNMMDGFKIGGAKIERQAENDKTEFKEAVPGYSTRKKEITDYFFDIVPRDLTAPDEKTSKNAEPQKPAENDSESAPPPSPGFPTLSAQAGYDDSKIAEVNYFAGAVKYSTIADVDKKEIMNPVDRAVLEAENEKAALPPKEDLQAATETAPTVQGKEQSTPAENPPLQNSAPQENLQAKNSAPQSEAQPLSFPPRNFPPRNSEPQKPFRPNETKNASLEIAGKKYYIKPKAVSAPLNSAPIIKSLKNSHADFAAEAEAAATIPPASSYTAAAAAQNPSTEFVFYEQVKPQLDELFKTGAKFDALEKLMPETRWIKVDYDDSGKYYVVGLIGSKPDYICYGVPAKYSASAPPEFCGYCSWLPLDAASPEGEGYWLMFQDAVTGESVTDNII